MKTLTIRQEVPKILIRDHFERFNGGILSSASLENDRSLIEAKNLVLRQAVHRLKGDTIDIAILPHYELSNGRLEPGSENLVEATLLDLAGSHWLWSSSQSS